MNIIDDDFEDQLYVEALYEAQFDIEMHPTEKAKVRRENEKRQQWLIERKGEK